MTAAPSCPLCGSPLPILSGLIFDCVQHPVGVMPAANRGQDAGVRDVGDKPCCKRVRCGEHYGWCQLHDGHERLPDTDPRYARLCIPVFGDAPEPSEFGPAQARRRRW